jgi:glycosyl transferase family 25
MERNDLIGGAYYINLDSRIDRRTQIEIELDKIGVKVQRFPAVVRTPGILGCGISHLAVLKEAKARNLKNVLIFEDDFELTVSREKFWQSISTFFDSNLDYKVLMISYNLKKSNDYSPFLYEVLFAETTSGYLVNSSAYDDLIRLYENSIPKLEQTGQHWIYANDQIWVKLQERGGWYALKERLGKQRASFSDCSLIYQDYNV